MAHNSNTQQKGAALMFVILFLLFTGIAVVSGSTSQVVRDYQTARDNVNSVKAYYLSESAVEDVYYRLKNGLNYDTTEVLVFDGATATTTVTDTASGKTITAQGNADDRFRSVELQASSAGTEVNLYYAALADRGGINLENGSLITALSGSGNVYSNAPITGGNGSVVNGTAVSASDMVEDTVARSMVCNADVEVGRTDSQEDYAQSFIATDNIELSKVALYLKKVGNPSDRTVRLVADNGGSPITSDLASATLDKDLVGSNYAWIEMTFDNPYTLVSGKKYWIVLDADKNNNKYWIWCKDAADSYAGGEPKYSKDWDNKQWSSEGGDLTFRLFLGTGESWIEGLTINGDAKAHTIKDSVVGGDAYYADASTLINTTVSGNTYSGSADPSTIPMPISSSTIAQWKADAAAGGTISGDCPEAAGCADTMGPVKIDGDLEVKNNDMLNLTGVVYVTGEVKIQNNAIVRCAQSLGENSCILLSDDEIKVKNNALLLGSGNPKSFPLVVSTRSDDEEAIEVQNSSIGGVFYAPNGELYLHNVVSVTAAVAYRIKMKNNAQITYDPNLSSMFFTTGGASTWDISSWAEVQ